MILDVCMGVEKYQKVGDDEMMMRILKPLFIDVHRAAR